MGNWLGADSPTAVVVAFSGPPQIRVGPPVTSISNFDVCTYVYKYTRHLRRCYPITCTIAWLSTPRAEISKFDGWVKGMQVSCNTVFCGLHRCQLCQHVAALHFISRAHSQAGCTSMTSLWIRHPRTALAVAPPALAQNASKILYSRSKRTHKEAEVKDEEAIEACLWRRETPSRIKGRTASSLPRILKLGGRC